MSLCACACRLVKPDFLIGSVRERPLEAGSQAHFRFMSGGRDLKPQTFGEQGGWARGPSVGRKSSVLGLAPTKDDFPLDLVFALAGSSLPHLCVSVAVCANVHKDRRSRDGQE